MTGPLSLRAIATIECVRSIFDRIWDSTLEASTEAFLKFNVSQDSTTLNAVVEMILNMSIESECFGDVCAKICEAQMDIELKTDPLGQSPFRDALVTLVQDTFKGKIYEAERKEEMLAIEAEDDLDEKEFLTEELAEMDAEFRVKKHGCLSFIGELFNRGVLPADFISFCLSDLIETMKARPPSPPSMKTLIEDTITFIVSVGEKLTNKGTEQNIDLDHAVMELTNIEGRIPRSMRHMIEDMIEIKDEKWRPMCAFELIGWDPLSDIEAYGPDDDDDY